MNKEKKVMPGLQGEGAELRGAVMFILTLVKLDEEYRQASKNFERAMKEWELNEGKLNEGCTYLEKALWTLMMSLNLQLSLSMAIGEVKEDEVNKFKEIDNAFNKALKNFDGAKKNYNEAIKENYSDKANKYLTDEITHLKKALDSVKELLIQSLSMGEVNEDEANKIKEINNAFNKALKDFDEAKKNWNEAIKRNDFYNANRYLNDEITHLKKALDSVKMKVNSVETITAKIKEFIMATEPTQLDQKSKQELEAFDRAINEGNPNEAAIHFANALTIDRELIKNWLENLLKKLELMGVKVVVNKDEADDAFNRALEGFHEAKKNYDEAIKRNDFYNANRYLKEELIHLIEASNIMKASFSKAQDKVNEAIDRIEDSIKAIKRS